MNSKRKLLVIGVDQAIPCLIDTFVREEKLPNIEKLIKSGVKGEAYSCPPCDTPTNWATIATGAPTAIHGATSFYLHIPGETFEFSLKNRSRTQLSKYAGAEYFWTTADKNGYSPFVINYPAGWPSNFEKGAMSLFTWSVPESLPQKILSGAKLKFSNKSKNPKKQINPIEEPELEIKSKSPILGISFEIKGGKITKTKTLDGYIVDKNGRGYDTFIYLEIEKGITHELREKETSEWIDIKLETEYGELPCLFQLEIENIENNGTDLKLYRSSIYNTKGWSVPESFAEDLIKHGIFSQKKSEDNEVEYMISGDIAPYLEYARDESLSLGKAITYAKQSLKWDVCFFHIHHLDSVNHRTLGPVFPEFPNYNEKDASIANNQIEIAYKIIDELVGNLLKSCVDEHTIVLFVSDHGAIPVWKNVNITLPLEEAGLLKYQWNQSKKEYVIDWKETKVYPYMEPPYIWVNLKGRDPKGIVSSSEFESVREQTIDALENFRDQDTGEKIVKKVLRKEDAEYLGQNGERVGDIIYFLKPPYQIFDGKVTQLNAARKKKRLYKKPAVYDAQVCFGAHAYYLPDETQGDYSISVPMIFNGPGIKNGVKLNEIVNLIDIAPTLSHLLNIPNPENAQGRILTEILE
ncbi:MAG: alkaline phosphatase family protein [Promethearchaeati archaeon]